MNDKTTTPDNKLVVKIQKWKKSCSKQPIGDYCTNAHNLLDKAIQALTTQADENKRLRETLAQWVDLNSKQELADAGLVSDSQDLLKAALDLIPAAGDVEKSGAYLHGDGIARPYPPGPDSVEVPREPTAMQIQQGRDHLPLSAAHMITDRDMTLCYKAMLTAQGSEGEG